MTSVTETLQSDIKSIVTSLSFVQSEAQDIYKQYFDTDATGLVGALAYDDAATVGTKVKSQDYLSGITLVDKLTKFFTNSAVASSDYLATCHIMMNGSAILASPLSVSVEDIGFRMKALCSVLVELFKKSNAVLKKYTANEIDVAVAAISSSRIVFGADMTKSELLTGITLIEQFKKMMNNEVVTTGDYASNLMVWNRLS